MKIVIEIFFSKIVGEEIQYQKNLIKVSEKISDPDELVKEVVGLYCAGKNVNRDDVLIHSTSWRYEPMNNLIITYLVYSDCFSFLKEEAKVIYLTDFELALCDNVFTPRPLEIKEINIISHALRHLSFLIKSDPVIGGMMRDKDTIKVFHKIPHSLAFKL